MIIGNQAATFTHEPLSSVVGATPSLLGLFHAQAPVAN
jgi:hypothetical protein